MKTKIFFEYLSLSFEFEYQNFDLVFVSSIVPSLFHCIIFLRFFHFFGQFLLKNHKKWKFSKYDFSWSMKWSLSHIIFKKKTIATKITSTREVWTTFQSPPPKKKSLILKITFYLRKLTEQNKVVGVVPAGTAASGRALTRVNGGGKWRLKATSRIHLLLCGRDRGCRPGNQILRTLAQMLELEGQLLH